MVDVTLDLKGLLCPLPVLRANKATRELPPGTFIQVLVTDPQAPKDFESFCQTAGYDYLECDEQDGTFSIRFRKALE